MLADDIVLTPEISLVEGAVFKYFVDVGNMRAAQVAPQQKPIADNVIHQLGRVLPHPDSALHAYCSARYQSRERIQRLICPFGINRSQLAAMERAFSSQVSVIEGPPGTGKTQTILNIISNVVLRGGTVAVVSNNNAAVENVYEKLAQAGLDYFVAKLGSTENRQQFFRSLPAVPLETSHASASMQQIEIMLHQLKQQFDAFEDAARLRAEIDELTIEERYLKEWQNDNVPVLTLPLSKYGLSPKKCTDLMAYLEYLSARKVRVKDRIELLLNFRILRTGPFKNHEKRKAAIYALQLHYYEQAIAHRRALLASCEDILERRNYKALQASLAAASMEYLKHAVHDRFSRQESQAFDVDNYRKNFDAFLKRFPIIGSSTHSIVNSLAQGALLDYVIIDEASQQDVVPGVLAFACARNVVVVGDRKQLPHIPGKLDLAAPDEFYDCAKYSILESCLGVFGDSLPVTLLKEHYRCHPRIIQFCNQQFYNNQLIPMTQDAGEAALKLIVTAKGNHTRHYSNLRELDSLLATLESVEGSSWEREDGRGFIAPFNAQVALSNTRLPADFVKDTVHKFQGRECGEVVFSTVLDRKGSSKRDLSFVDDPHLVNVAVSRAKSRFTLVTGEEVFSTSRGHIAALVRHIEYYANEKHVFRAPVISAFDLLYREFDESLDSLNARLRPDDSRYKSEQIVAQLLREATGRPEYSQLMFHAQVALIQLVRSPAEQFTEREKDFMKNRASCDFVVYYKVGKRPLGAIEVDGGYHELAPQCERDGLKNGILQKAGLPLLRLRTIESHIESRIHQFLSDCTRID